MLNVERSKRALLWELQNEEDHSSNIHSSEHTYIWGTIAAPQWMICRLLRSTTGTKSSWRSVLLDSWQSMNLNSSLGFEGWIHRPMNTLSRCFAHLIWIRWVTQQENEIPCTDESKPSLANFGSPCIFFYFFKTAEGCQCKVAECKGQVNMYR